MNIHLSPFYELLELLPQYNIQSRYGPEPDALASYSALGISPENTSQMLEKKNFGKLSWPREEGSERPAAPLSRTQTGQTGMNRKIGNEDKPLFSRRALAA